jgi:hypothetical protein
MYFTSSVKSVQPSFMTVGVLSLVGTWSDFKQGEKKIASDFDGLFALLRCISRRSKLNVLRTDFKLCPQIEKEGRVINIKKYQGAWYSTTFISQCTIVYIETE